MALPPCPWQPPKGDSLEPPRPDPPLPHEQVRFAHNSERQFARLLDFYGIEWQYEPRTFTLERDKAGNPVQAFTPDFYLPAYDLYIEITNAANTAPVLEALRAAGASAPGRADVEDVTERRALLAVQGPEARRRIATLAPEAAAVAHFGVGPTVLPGGSAGFVGGTGYTGEDGVELFVPVEAAVDVWRALLAAGVVPAGLGARDTLRLEMGYPLHGHELGPGITPLQAGLGWVVGWDKPAFAGRDALLAEKERGPARRLAGVMLADRQVPRAECG